MLRQDLKSLHDAVRESLAYVSSLGYAAGTGVDDSGGGGGGGGGVGGVTVEVLRRFLESATKELEEVCKHASLWSC